MLNRFQSTAWADSPYNLIDLHMSPKQLLETLQYIFCYLHMSYSVLCLNTKDVSVIQ